MKHPSIEHRRIQMAHFELPTTQPSQKPKSKQISFGAAEIDKPVKKKAPQKKAASNKEKPKSATKTKSVRPTNSEQPNLFSSLLPSGRREVPLSVIISKSNFQKIEKLRKAHYEDKSKVVEAILQAFNVDDAISTPSFYNLIPEERTERLNLKLTKLEAQKLEKLGLRNKTLALSLVLSAFDVDTALAELKKKIN